MNSFYLLVDVRKIVCLLSCKYLQFIHIHILRIQYRSIGEELLLVDTDWYPEHSNAGKL